MSSTLCPSLCVCVCVQLLSRAQLPATPWAVVLQAPLCVCAFRLLCGILQARILEWVVISPSRGSSQHRDHLLHWQVDSLPLEPPKRPSHCVL